MHLGPVDHRGAGFDILQLAQRKGWPDHVSGQLLAAFGDQGVDVRLERDQIAEGLYKQDKRRPCVRLCGAEALGQPLSDQAALDRC